MMNEYIEKKNEIRELNFIPQKGLFYSNGFLYFQKILPLLFFVDNTNLIFQTNYTFELEMLISHL